MNMARLDFQGKLTLFADDATFTYESSKKSTREEEISDIERQINQDLQLLRSFIIERQLVINTEKSVVILIKGQKITRSLNVFYGSQMLPSVSKIKLLGILFDETLSFASHIQMIKKKVKSRISMLTRVRHFLPISTVNRLYLSCVNPLFNYCSVN